MSIMRSVDSVVAVDGHVHLHGNAATTLRRASTTIAAAAPRADLGALLLTESTGDSAFATLSRDAMCTPGRESIALRWSGGPLDLLIIAGRQVVTAERVEVLLPGTLSAPDDGTPIDDVLDWAEERAVAAVLPWGFGKWLGRRRRTVARVLETRRTARAGDIQGRPIGVPERLLRTFAAGSIAGTDPLPMAGDERRIGSYGTLVSARIDPAAPARSLLDALAVTACTVTFGQRQTLPAAIRLQLALRRRSNGPSS
ncbi:hypothetical protein EAH87_14830 [Sphingomonas koreensis]|nr:hypothetical protein EAH87_14830 [Sphingomonas koreensis]